MEMMKNYKSYHSWKVLCDKRLEVVRLLLEWFKIRRPCTGSIFQWQNDSWSIRNLTEGVDWEAKRLDVVSKRLSGRLCRRLRERLCNSFKGKLFRRVFRGNWYMFGNEGSVEASGSFGTSGSSVDKLSISLTDLLTGNSELEFSHEVAIYDLQIGVSVQWEQAMFGVTSLWGKSDVVFWSGYQREIKGYEVDVQVVGGKIRHDKDQQVKEMDFLLERILNSKPWEAFKVEALRLRHRSRVWFRTKLCTLFFCRISYVLVVTDMDLKPVTENLDAEINGDWEAAVDKRNNYPSYSVKC
ncbi:hypothetical protein Tco_0576118 [Tanacetum coccineum]